MPDVHAVQNGPFGTGEFLRSVVGRLHRCPPFVHGLMVAYDVNSVKRDATKLPLATGCMWPVSDRRLKFAKRPLAVVRPAETRHSLPSPVSNPRRQIVCRAAN